MVKRTILGNEVTYQFCYSSVLESFDKCRLVLFPGLNKQLNKLSKYCFIELTLQYTECLIDFKLIRCANLSTDVVPPRLNNIAKQVLSLTLLLAYIHSYILVQMPMTKQVP